MKESNTVENYPQPLDTLLVNDVFYVINGNPNVAYKLVAKSDSEWTCKVLTGPNAGEFTNGFPTAMCIKQKVH